MVTTEVQGLQAVYYGLSTDEKPIEYVSNGSAFVEFQPDESVVVYFFDGENKRWISDSGGGGNGGNRGIPEAPTDGKNYVRYNAMWKEMPVIDPSTLIGANKDLSNLTTTGETKFLASIREDENVKSEVSHQAMGVSRVVKSKKNSQIVTSISNIDTNGNGYHEIEVGHTDQENDKANIYLSKDELLISISKEDKVSEGYPEDAVKKVEIYMRPEFNRPILRSFYGGYGFNGELAVLEDVNMKVDKVAGKQLSQENFTTAEKSKLAGLESSHFKGSYLTVAALNAAHATSEDGGYAYVGNVGEEAVNYIWDVENNQWTLGGKGTNDTPAQVKEKYESNLNTNAFTDAEKTKLANLPNTLADGANKDLSNLSETGESKFVKSEFISDSKEKRISYSNTSVGSSISHSTKPLMAQISSIIDSGDNPCVGASVLNDLTGEGGAFRLDERSFTVTVSKKNSLGTYPNTFFTFNSTSPRPSFENQEKQISGYLAMLEDVDKKVDKVSGYGLSQENFTSAEKTKLARIGNDDLVMGEVDTGRKDPWGDAIYRHASSGKTSGVASQRGPLLATNVKRIWGFGGGFGDGTAQTPLSGYLATAEHGNFPYTAYPHIIGTDLYLYHYLLKDRLDYHVYVEYTKVTP